MRIQDKFRLWGHSTHPVNREGCSVVLTIKDIDHFTVSTIHGLLVNIVNN